MTREFYLSVCIAFYFTIWIGHIFVFYMFVMFILSLIKSAPHPLPSFLPSFNKRLVNTYYVLDTDIWI